MRIELILEILGYVGATVIAIAYLPQIIHMVKRNCSAGVSINAWLIWLAGGILIFLHALSIGDVVFIILQIVNISANLAIIFLARKYRKSLCSSHQHGQHERKLTLT